MSNRVANCAGFAGLEEVELSEPNSTFYALTLSVREVVTKFGK